ncbi:TPM domain-containing protein [Hymenobacter elongatus]|uniref:TPM domain-containing protein n=1 Tax=Hymenobacter elongatus TaxID=877208 RepID=A0A4Z0PEH3_9BACT|nr:TPM domain-containing protein [Hymenobacter elongatus]TGE12615.1 TPM domain-containing protein [Hymenobacter elongatus]
MSRFLLLLLLFVSAGWGQPLAAAPAEELPPRPSPFRFVNDQAQLLSTADAKTLENGLRRYAETTGTQLVVVLVPTLGGRDVADYGRALGEAWNVGQRDKNNGLILLVGAQERTMTIQAGSGLRSAITPELTARVITQQLAPSFKQGKYYAGLREGLNTLMLAANPASNPQKNLPATTTDAAEAEAAGAMPQQEQEQEQTATALPEPAAAAAPTMPMSASPAEPESSGFGLGIGALLVGALVIGGALWLLLKLFRRFSRPAPAAAPTVAPSNPAPDFLPNQPRRGPAPVGGQPQPQGPDFLGNRGGGGMGSGMGGILMTGAAAAAGAYLGNRMATGGNDSHQGGQLSPDNPAASPNQDAAAGAATGGGFPALDDSAPADNSPAPDYFTEEAAAPDYFTPDDNSSSYDDPSSGDSGGGDFDDSNNNSGSW